MVTSLPAIKSKLRPTTQPLPPTSSSSDQPSLRMSRMSEPDQGCFMIISESVHPNLRLGYPSSSKILAGLTAFIVNGMMAFDNVSTGLQSLLGSTTLLPHAITNVTSLSSISATSISTSSPSELYPGNLFLLLEYIPTNDVLVKMQITIIVEYVLTEILSAAGNVTVSKKAEQSELFDNASGSGLTKGGLEYGDYPSIRPSDIKSGIKEDEDLNKAFGGLFK